MTDDNHGWLRGHTPQGAKDEGRTYKAYHAPDRPPERLELVRKAAPSRFPAYSSLIDMSFDPRYGKAIALLCNHAIFHIEGENLAPVAQAIASGNCNRVVEFDPARHDKPTAGQPIVTEIRIDVEGEDFSPRSPSR